MGSSILASLSEAGGYNSLRQLASPFLLARHLGKLFGTRPVLPLLQLRGPIPPSLPSQQTFQFQSITLTVSTSAPPHQFHSVSVRESLDQVGTRPIAPLFHPSTSALHHAHSIPHISTPPMPPSPSARRSLLTYLHVSAHTPPHPPPAHFPADPHPFPQRTLPLRRRAPRAAAIRIRRHTPSPSIFISRQYAPKPPAHLTLRPLGQIVTSIHNRSACTPPARATQNAGRRV